MGECQVGSVWHNLSQKKIFISKPMDRQPGIMTRSSASQEPEVGMAIYPAGEQTADLFRLRQQFSEHCATEILAKADNSQFARRSFGNIEIDAEQKSVLCPATA
jgi:hypothetical protein